uniref:receptor protein-tyrosine kinase n=1 Tax=Acrobeloides nanus TaxID=290746 RepID=A0A914EKV8_9BILA
MIIFLDCIGTKNGRSKTTPDPNKPYNHYVQLKNLFQNCKRIIGNLEITHIDNGQLIDDDEENFTTENGTILLRKKKPFWFLEHLEQISGYLLIYSVDVERIDLPNLRIIWGRKLISDRFSFSVEHSRLKFLNMPKFRSIENGEVMMRRLPKLCYVKKINYYELLGKHSKHKIHFNNVSTDISCANAPECDPDCNGFCYGSEPGMCQDVYRHHCSLSCASGMCLKNATGEETCCDERCTAGCYGTGAAHCVGCKDFEQDGVCVDRCRGIYRYDPITRRQTELPDEEKRYTFEKHCDNKCPTDTLIEGENCVERCSDGFYQEPSNPKKECIVCKGACPKECFLNETINAENIGNLTNCTRINGNIVILTHVWKARQYEKDGPIIPALKAEDLYALKDITFVSGFVNIEGGFISPPKSLDFLSNLEYIGGRGNHHGYTLQILANSEIEYLGLKSLKQITSGHVVIKLNANLCYGYTINWKKFMTKDFNIIYERNTPNHTCVDKGRICNETCVQEEGCWGPGPKMCVQCKNFIKDDECANHCPIENGYFIEKASRNESDAIEENVNAPQKCERCYKNCKKCEGSGEENCTECLPHAFVLQIPTQNNSFCVDKCPENYTYPVGNTCVNCHEACLPYGCTGPDSHVGTGGCNKCQYGVTEGDQVRCLTGRDKKTICTENELTHHYPTITNREEVVEGVCAECQDVCVQCTQHGDIFGECFCKYFRVWELVNGSDEDKCVKECPENSYLVKNKTKKSYGVCQRCHSYCADHMGCSGPEALHCEQCKEAGIMDKGNM